MKTEDSRHFTPILPLIAQGRHRVALNPRAANLACLIGNYQDAFSLLTTEPSDRCKRFAIVAAEPTGSPPRASNSLTVRLPSEATGSNCMRATTLSLPMETFKA